MTFYFAGMTLALFLATALALKPCKHRAERVLAVLAVYLALDLLLRGYLAGTLYRSFPHLLGLDRSLLFLYGPPLLSRLVGRRTADRRAARYERLIREFFSEVSGKYAKTRLDPALAEEYRARLISYMETDRSYRDPLLTLPQLAKQLGIAPHPLSQVINGLLGMNFYTFVNRHRIEYAKKLLAEGADNILAVAYESGFNAKSAFNTHFRTYTGMTPSAFRRRFFRVPAS